MIILFTDFGWNGPYAGQIKAVLHTQAPDETVIDLMHDAPSFNPRAAAYLLAALADEFPQGTVFLGVIDPGVGDPARRPAIVKADGRWFVGPDNGLFNVVAMRASRLQWWDINWQPRRLSHTFHGRDLFAPVVARIVNGEHLPGDEQRVEDRLQTDWPEDLAQIIYIDHFGNAITGIRAAVMVDQTMIQCNGYTLKRANTFSDVEKGQGFWYENSVGLVEIAINSGRADTKLGLNLGDSIQMT